jgi:hypothetical protein
MRGIAEQEGHVENAQRRHERADGGRRGDHHVDGAELGAFDHVALVAESAGREQLHADAVVRALGDEAREVLGRQMIRRRGRDVVAEAQGLLRHRGRAERQGAGRERGGESEVLHEILPRT